MFLWSDDNLSNDYFWKFLTPQQIQAIADYKMYARVCCFKGIDEESFSLNTLAAPELFDTQFDLFGRLHQLGLDLYGYITLTASTKTNFEYAVPMFLDRVQNIHENLPLRIVPLEITEFKPVISRIKNIHEDAMSGQYKAVEVWTKELSKRFNSSLLDQNITDITI